MEAAKEPFKHASQGQSAKIQALLSLLIDAQSLSCFAVIFRFLQWDILSFCLEVRVLLAQLFTFNAFCLQPFCDGAWDDGASGQRGSHIRSGNLQTFSTHPFGKEKPRHNCHCAISLVFSGFGRTTVRRGEHRSRPAEQEEQSCFVVS